MNHYSPLFRILIISWQIMVILVDKGLGTVVRADAHWWQLSTRDITKQPSSFLLGGTGWWLQVTQWTLLIRRTIDEESTGCCNSQATMISYHGGSTNWHRPWSKPKLIGARPAGEQPSYPWVEPREWRGDLSYHHGPQAMLSIPGGAPGTTHWSRAAAGRQHVVWSWWLWNMVTAGHWWLILWLWGLRLVIWLSWLTMIVHSG